MVGPAVAEWLKGNLAMIVLSRKLHERIFIGDDIVLTVVSIAGGRVRIGIEAPDNVQVHREEVYQAIKAKELQDGESS